MLNHEHRLVSFPKTPPTLREAFRDELSIETKLEQLAIEANLHHLESRRAINAGLHHARKAGDALIAAKRALGVGLSRKERKVFGKTRGRYGRWLKKTFRGSKELARIYVRIAKHWNDPVILNARVKGLEVGTISQFLTLIRKKPKTKEPTPDKLLITDILNNVRAELETLKRSDVKILSEEFDSLWALVRQEVRRLRKSTHHDSEVA